VLEGAAVARVRGVPLGEELLGRTLALLDGVPREATASLHLERAARGLSPRFKPR
jgi:hypothetical protein